MEHEPISMVYLKKYLPAAISTLPPPKLLSSLREGTT
jgi:hypothetical protein